MSVSVAQAQLYFLAVTRILAVLVHVPVLGGRLVPNPVKVGLGLLLGLAMLPWQPLPSDAAALPAAAFGFAMGREALIGTMAGFGAALTFGAVQIAGDLMGIGSGFGAGQIINPTFENTGSVINNFFVMIATLYFLAINGHLSFLLGVARTFQLVPLNAPLPQFTSETLVRMSAQLITVGVQLALPVLGAVLLTDLTLGLLARVAPQVQVFFLGLPLKLAVGLVGLALALAALAPSLTSLFQALGERTLSILGV